MNVKQLRAALEGCDDNARVLLSAKNEFGDWAQGDVIEIAVTAIDGTDTLVALINCVENADGDSVYDAAPQFKRVAIASGDPEAMARDLRAGFATPTQALDKGLPSAIQELIALLKKEDK